MKPVTLRKKLTRNMIFALILSYCILNSANGLSDLVWGIYKIEIKKDYNLISLPLQTIRLVEGKITNIVSGTVTTSANTFTIDQYKNDILFVRTGAGEGYHYKISSNTNNTITIPETLSSSVLAGDYFCIYKSYTLKELFGDYNGPLYADTNKNYADEIHLWDKNTQSFSTQLWLCNTPGYEGWYSGSTKVDNNSITLDPNQACFVLHKIDSVVKINYTGTVPDTKQTLNIKSDDNPSTTNDNILGQSFPAAVTINNSGLDAVLKAGKSSGLADNIYIWNYTNQNFELPIWRYNGNNNWYRGSQIANDIGLVSAEGFLIRVKDTNINKYWQRNKPYMNP